VNAFSRTIIASNMHVMRLLKEEKFNDNPLRWIKSMFQRKQILSLVDDEGKGRRVEALNGISLSVIAFRLCLEEADVIIWYRQTAPTIHSTFKKYLNQRGVIEICPEMSTRIMSDTQKNKKNTIVEIINQDSHSVQFWEFYSEGKIVRPY